jgi:hypothetical protein
MVRAYRPSTYDDTIIRYCREFARLDVKSYLVAYPESEKRKINKHIDVIAHIYRRNNLGPIQLDPLEKPIAAPAEGPVIEPPRIIYPFSEQYHLEPLTRHFQTLAEYLNNYEDFQHHSSLVPLYDLHNPIDRVLFVIREYYDEVKVQKLVTQNRELLQRILIYLHSIDSLIGPTRSTDASLVANLTGIECEYLHSSAPSPFARVYAKTKDEPAQEKPSHKHPTEREAIPALEEEKSLNPEISAPSPSAPPPIVKRPPQPRVTAPERPARTTTTTTATTTTQTAPPVVRVSSPPMPTPAGMSSSTSSTSSAATTSARLGPASISRWQRAMQGLGRLIHWRQAPDVLTRVSRLIQEAAATDDVGIGDFMVANQEEIQNVAQDLLEFLIGNPHALVSQPNMKIFVNRFYRRMIDSRIFSPQSLEIMNSINALLGIR